MYQSIVEKCDLSGQGVFRQVEILALGEDVPMCYHSVPGSNKEQHEPEPGRRQTQQHVGEGEDEPRTKTDPGLGSV